VRSKHKRAKKREKKAASSVVGAEQLNKTAEVIGILKGLQASPNRVKKRRRFWET
jgi:hypothetical protein